MSDVYAAALAAGETTSKARKIADVVARMPAEMRKKHIKQLEQRAEKSSSSTSDRERRVASTLAQIEQESQKKIRKFERAKQKYQRLMRRKINAHEHTDVEDRAAARKRFSEMTEDVDRARLAVLRDRDPIAYRHEVERREKELQQQRLRQEWLANNV